MMIVIKLLRIILWRDVARSMGFEDQVKAQDDAHNQTLQKAELFEESIRGELKNS